MVLPNFIVIGAAKAGTSSLHHYLSQHPQVFMPSLKEPRFFALEGEKLNFNNPDQAINYDSITDLESYLELFKGVSNEIAIGEASPIYMYSPKAPHRIRHYIPDAKIIAILRDPVDRAFSCFTHLKREGYENLSFEAALEIEEKRIQENWAHLWHYKSAGFYTSQLKTYFEIFPRENIKIFLFDDICKDTSVVLHDIFSFLEIDFANIPDLTHQNVSGMPKNMILQKFLKRKNVVRSTIKAIVPSKLRHQVAQEIKQWNVGEKPEFNPTTRDYLKSIYKDDILQLQDLIGRDLTMWLK